jgi:hypothetical protein
MCVPTSYTISHEDVYITTQVIDYHIALRIDNGVLAVNCLFKLTRMVICLDGNIRGYQKSMMMQLILLMHQEKNKLPQWDMLKKSIAVFNEEAGELSFSVLSRVVLGDNMKANFQHMDKMYRLTRAYASTSDEIRNGQGRTRRKNGHYLLTDKDTEVLTVAAFMLETIRAITNNTFTQYTGKAAKKNPAFVANANLTEPFTSTEKFWQQDVVTTGMLTMKKYIGACSSTWALDKQLHRDWPSFNNPMRVAVLQENYHALMEAKDGSDVEEQHADTASDSSSDEEPNDEPIVGAPEIPPVRGANQSVVQPPKKAKRPRNRPVSESEPSSDEDLPLVRNPGKK